MISKKALYDIVFGNETRAGRLFDLVLLWMILFSVLVAIIDSVPAVHIQYYSLMIVLEWFFTILFSAEYIVRILISPKPFKYIFSSWGLIDLMAVLPTYFSILLAGYQYLIIIRIVRLLRIFRILKMARFLSESRVLIDALKTSFYKISLFLVFVLILVIIMGAVMYVVEGGKGGFSSIPNSIYWAIITITTVGYGDIVPQTIAGKFIASFVMLIGYSIIAVPTGIVTVEFSKKRGIILNTLCKKCRHQNPDESKYCNQCGERLSD